MVGSTNSKRIARIAAIQFMYQHDIADSVGVNNGLLDDFVNHYIKGENSYSGINLKFFKRMINYFSEEINFNELIDNSLNDGKNLANAPMIEICILKVAIIEMIFESTDIPIIINEYVEIAKEFIEPKAAKFINAILDKISKRVERKCLIKA